MLRRQIVAVLVLGFPAASGMGELVGWQGLGEPDQPRVVLHCVRAGLARCASEPGRVLQADLARRDTRARVGDRGKLGAGAYIARSIGTRQAAVLAQQPRPAVAVTLALCDRCGGFGLEQLDAAAQLLGQPQGAAQLVARRCVDGVECGGEVSECLLHVREHVFTLRGGCHKTMFSISVDHYS